MLARPIAKRCICLSDVSLTHSEWHVSAGKPLLTSLLKIFCSLSIVPLSVRGTKIVFPQNRSEGTQSPWIEPGCIEYARFQFWAPEKQRSFKWSDLEEGLTVAGGAALRIPETDLLGCPQITIEVYKEWPKNQRVSSEWKWERRMAWLAWWFKGKRIS